MQLAVYRKENRKRSLRHGRGWRWLAVATLLCACAFALYRWGDQMKARAAAAHAFIFDSSYFKVREIQVRGGNKVSGSEILAMAGLRHGVNLWKVEPASIEKKIARHPWVRRVLVRREFPRRVVIEVEERKPRAIVAMGKLYYVDNEGMVFKEVAQGDSVEFPLLTGLRPEELSRNDPAMRNRIQDAIRLGELMAKDSRTLSEIHFESADRLVLYTTAYPIALYMGSGDWESKLQRLDRVLTLWKGHENRLASLDMSFRDQVVARLRKARP